MSAPIKNGVSSTGSIAHALRTSLRTATCGSERPSTLQAKMGALPTHEDASCRCHWPVERRSAIWNLSRGRIRSSGAHRCLTIMREAESFQGAAEIDVGLTGPYQTVQKSIESTMGYGHKAAELLK